MKIVADREICVGAGICVLTDPELFDQDPEDGRVLILNERPGSERADVARQAIELCPSGALSLLESTTQAP
jgi:ferredoxin